MYMFFNSSVHPNNSFTFSFFSLYIPSVIPSSICIYMIHNIARLIFSCALAAAARGVRRAAGASEGAGEGEGGGGRAWGDERDK